MEPSSLPVTLSRPLEIFLCHAWDDKAKVRELHQWLRRQGYAPWLDEENLLPGQDWRVEIAKAVRAADVVLVCMSRQAVNREGYIQEEILAALDVVRDQPEGTIFLIPVKLEECSIPERLNRWHWAELYEENGYERLGKGLRERAEDRNTRMEKLDLTAFANLEFDWYKNPPSGLVCFEGVYYKILDGKRAVVHTGNLDRSSLTTKIAIPVEKGTGVQAAHMLINGNWVHQAVNRTVGLVSLIYADGPAMNVPLIANQTIVETWCYNDEMFGRTLEEPPTGVRWREVDHEAQRRSPRETQGSDAATAFLHALSITADPTRDLSRIEISATSRSSGIILTAITIERSG